MHLIALTCMQFPDQDLNIISLQTQDCSVLGPRMGEALKLLMESQIGQNVRSQDALSVCLCACAHTRYFFSLSLSEEKLCCSKKYLIDFLLMVNGTHNRMLAPWFSNFPFNFIERDLEYGPLLIGSSSSKYLWCSACMAKTTPIL